MLGVGAAGGAGAGGDPMNFIWLGVAGALVLAVIVLLLGRHNGHE